MSPITAELKDRDVMTQKPVCFGVVDEGRIAIRVITNFDLLNAFPR